MLPELADEFTRRVDAGGVKGEIVVVIDGPSEHEGSERAEQTAADARQRAAELAGEGLRAKQIARQLVQECGIARNEAYELALQAGRS